MNKTKITGLALISFLFSIAGIIISALLLREDVVSTAHTLKDYFPIRYNVTPSSTWEGAIVLGLFISVLQVISANVAFSGRFSNTSRAVAFVGLISAVVFDNWTDVVFRSAYLTGDIKVAYATTIAFYTFGSEVLQGLSWLVFVSTWRTAISDIMLGAAKFGAGVKSISSEWKSFQRAANNMENNRTGDNHSSNKPSPPAFPYRPPQNPGNAQNFKPFSNQSPRSDTKPRKSDYK